MFDFDPSRWVNARPCILVGAAFFALSPQLGQAATSSGILEVDLIFPRNDTYAPVTLMPVVFAVQNPSLAVPVGGSISWEVSQYSGSGFLGLDIGTVDLSQLNASSASSTYLSPGWTSHLAGIENTWFLTWTLSVANCSQSGDQVEGNNQGGGVIFTTRNNASVPDLVAATSPDTCNMTNGITLNVTGVEEAPLELATMQPSCAVLPNGPSPTPTPCAVTIDASAASSIAAVATSKACEVVGLPNVTLPGVSCSPTPTGKSSAMSRKASHALSFWVLFVFCGMCGLMVL